MLVINRLIQEISEEILSTARTRTTLQYTEGTKDPIKNIDNKIPKKPLAEFQKRSNYSNLTNIIKDTIIILYS